MEDIFISDLSYWRKRLTGAPPFLELPADNPRSSQKSSGFANFSFLIPKSLTDELRVLGHKSDADLFSTVLSAFKMLIYRYTNQEDILVGYSNISHISNVNESGKLVDGHLNKMIFRTDLSDDPVFTNLLKRVHNTVREAKDHQSLPFDILIQSLRTDGLYVDSLFQIVFEFVNAKSSEKASATSTENANIPTPDLHLSIIETNEGLSGLWTYNPHLFLETTVKRMAGHFQNLLLGVIANSHQSISKLPLLSTPERLQILFEWNNTAAEYPHNKCIHELFEEQVERTPNDVAVELYGPEKMNTISDKKKLTYHQLNTRSNQLAHYLRELGVGPDVLVGLCVTRSLEMMVGLMGILKAGGAYVPLDPGYPKERLQFMLKDSGVFVLLTEQKLLEELPIHDTQVICLDTGWDKIAQCSNKNMISGVKPENLAYVIYTSGSTGIPKGTLIIHRGVVNYLSWSIKEYAVAEGSGAPVNSSIAFDATVTSFFSPLLSGKRVLLLPEKEEIEALGTVLLSRNNFSLVKITPAHLEILRHLLPADQVSNQVKALVIGGEALLTKNLDLWRNHAPNTRLINEYGPTETVVGCCTYEVTTNNLFSEDVPIGRPILNTQIYILDRHMEPVPTGVSGEIYIGGAGLARGYLNRPDLTEQRFVSNPFTDDANARLYKTGDLARYLNDGNIVFLGRIDHQVKIRGYRIELGEIESTLSKHAFVEHVVVLAREDNPGDKRLVAYIVIKDQTPAVSDLRLFLGEKLPEYMVPAVFVFLKSLPLTSNGKVDRRALPVPDQQRTGSENSYIAPRDTTEQKLAEIFQNCLNIQRIGVADDFFELGGSSMQAAIVFSKIRKTLGIQLPLSTLIHSSTIEKLAINIRGEVKEKTWSCLVPIQPNGFKPPLFCVHGGWGNVLFYRHIAKHLGSDQPVYALQAKGLMDNDDPHYKVEDMAAHYIREIRSVQAKGPYYIAGYCFGAIAAFEIAQQLLSSGDKIAFLGSFNGIAPTDMQASKVNLQNSLKLFSIKHSLYSFRLIKFLIRRKYLEERYRTPVRIRALYYKFFFIQKRPLPQALRRFYVVDAIGKAQIAYSPKPYPGDLIIFRSPKIFKSPDLGWGRFIKGGLKTVDIPGEHPDRTRIMYEPFVPFLAQELKNHLGKDPDNNTHKISVTAKTDQMPLVIHKQKRDPEKAYVDSRDSVKLQLKKIFEKTLKVPSIGLDEDFFDLGGSSLQAAFLFGQIRKTFGVSLPLATLIQAPTIEQLASFVKQEKSVTHRSSLVPIQPKGSKPPLFCMHAGAGTVLFYRSLATHLGSDQPVFGLQAKGLNGEEPPHTRIEDMARHYINEIRNVQAQGPYYLAGYCLGAILAFEMAQQLKLEGHEVALLVSLNGVSPTYTHPRNGVITKENDEKEENHKKIYISSGRRKKSTFLHFIARLIYAFKLVTRIIKLYLRKLGYKFFLSVKRPLPEALGKMYFLETNSKIARAYHPKVYPGSMLIYYSPGIYKDSNLGWSGLTKEGIKSFIIPGEHENRRSIMNEPFVQFLAKELKKQLGENS